MAGKRSRNRGALERTVTALQTTGLLEEVDAAVVAACRSLAVECDAAPEDPRLWNQYLQALDRLYERAGGDDADDGLTAAFDELRAAVRDPKAS